MREKESAARTGAGLFAVLGGVSAVGYAAVPFVVGSDNPVPDFLRFFAIFFLLACVWGLSVWLSTRVEPGRGLVLTGAVLFRLALLPAGFSPESGGYGRQLLYADDVWRYLWEGHAWSAGLNPMRTPPARVDPDSLEPRWSAVYDKVGHRDLASPHPLGAQALFRAAAVAPTSVIAWKLLMAAFDLGAVWLVLRLAGPGARGTAMLLAYAWNPLVIKEFAGSGRIDAALVFFLLAAVAAPGARGGALLGAAALIEPGALLLSPALLRRSGWKALAGPFAAAVALALAPPMGLPAFAAAERFHAAVFRMLPASRFELMCGGAVAAAAALVWLSRRPCKPPESICRHVLWALGGFLLITPAFAPWRLAWVLPFAALRLSWFWLAFSGSVFLSYHAYLSFHEIPILSALELLMPLAVWAWLNGGIVTRPDDID